MQQVDERLQWGQIVRSATSRRIEVGSIQDGVRKLDDINFLSPVAKDIRVSSILP